MPTCPDCKKELIWGGDHDYEDYGLESEGIVSNYTCPNEDCTTESLIIYRDNEGNREKHHNQED